MLDDPTIFLVSREGKKLPVKLSIARFSLLVALYNAYCELAEGSEFPFKLVDWDVLRHIFAFCQLRQGSYLHIFF